MEPKIIFLGTSGDNIVTAKQLRASGGFVIMYDDIQYHVDPGPGAICKASEYCVNVRNTTAIVVTTNNIAQCNDVNALIDAMTYSGMDRKGVLVGNDTLYNGAEGYNPYLTKYHRALPEKLMILKSDHKIGIIDTEIRGLFAKQEDPNAMGLKFYTSKFKIAYSSDTSYDPQLLKDYKDAEILILNVPDPQGVKTKGRLNTDDALKIISNVKPHLTLITSFGIKMLKADPLMEARFLSKGSGTQVIAVKDGMVINPVSYDASIKQKTLNLYR